MAAMIDEDVLTFLNGHLGKDVADAYRKCSDFAYRDMCRTIDFSDELKETPHNKKLHRHIQERKRKLKAAVTAEIRQMVTELTAQSSLTQENFDGLFYKTCEKIIEIFHGTTVQAGSTLYFGQAQKWVNMTLKNLYVFAESHPGCGLDLNPLLPYMHIPIDNIVLDIVCGKRQSAAGWIRSL